MEELKDKTFATEAEEAAWWEANEDAMAEEFEKAMTAGTVGGALLVVRDAESVTKIQLDSEEIATVAAQAAERGLRYHTYLKMIIHEALRSAESIRRPANP